jgi:hypothetical protein
MEIKNMARRRHLVSLGVALETAEQDKAVRRLA